jgi:hypothetical protein
VLTEINAIDDAGAMLAPSGTEPPPPPPQPAAARIAATAAAGQSRVT